MAIAVEIPELAVVEFTHELAGHPQGTIGTVVVTHAEDDAYTVEVVDAKGRTLDLVDARAEDLRITRVV
jgi:hypothetical protein